MLYVRYLGLWVVWMALVVMCAAAQAADPLHDGTVVWSLEFEDNNDLSDWATDFWDHRGTQNRDHPPELSLQVEDGVLRFSSHFNFPHERTTYAVLGSSPSPGPSKRGFFGPPFNVQSKWPGIEVSEAPVIEVRSRIMHEKTASKLTVVYRTRSGQILARTYPIFYDEAWERIAVGQWDVVSINLYNEARVHGDSGANKIVAIQFHIESYSGNWQRDPEPKAFEVDYVRARRMNGQEWAEVDKRLAPLRVGFQMQPCPRVEEFFGVGFWGGINGDEHLERIARAGANVVLNVGGRFGDNVWGHYNAHLATDGEQVEESNEETRAVYWLKEQKRILNPHHGKYGRYGIYLMAGMERFDTAEHRRNGPGGSRNFRDLGQLNRWADEVTTVLQDEPYLLGWYMADEPHAAYLTNYLLAKQLLESRDRSRASVCLFGDIESAANFAPYSHVLLTDRYPGAPGNKAGYGWAIASWMREAREFTQAPHWITLGTFRSPSLGPITERDRADLLERSWLAIAEGAKVVTYFLYQGGDRWHCMVDGRGNPTLWYRAFEEFAGQVMPLGQVLVQTQPDDSHPILTSAAEIEILTGYVATDTGKERRAGVHVGTLKFEDRDALVLVTVNLDIDNPQQDVRMHLPLELTRDKRLYDLLELREVTIEEGSAPCHHLKPGGGWAYLLGSEEDFAWAKKLILAARAKQAERVAALDELDK